ncbi:HNH endonuclease [Saccharomonospora iraqiensis]|uniref:HNH endonuclease n=1 Tax=Saccharomonospora iraqiensis TaxID=52698 RepID=UPI00047AB37B|nr:HNH endonuclease signature motif containing protein [Saccharomonospora iraqiensis]
MSDEGGGDRAPCGALSRMDRIRTLGEHIARLQARQLREIAACVDGRTPADVAAELALTLTIGDHHARRTVDLATVLVSRLPSTLAAMETGVLDVYKASKVAEPTACLPDGKALQVDAILADRLSGKDPGALRQAVNRVVARVDPDGAADRAVRRRAERRVELIHGDDGTAVLRAELPAEVASAAYARVDRIARSLRRHGETRTTDQLRADVLADLLREAHTTTEGCAPRTRAEVFVHVALPTLLGTDDRPGELAGHGPVPAQVAREIAFDSTSTWRRLVTDPLTGSLLDVGRARYRPPAATDEFVRVRDHVCRFPGCHRPSRFGDLDHVVDWGRGRHGRTAPDNLVGLCRRHHRLKDVPGWSFRLNRATHRFTVHTPSGHTHGTDPRPLLDPGAHATTPDPDPPPF